MNPDTVFDFNQARLRHISFKSRLRSALYGAQTNEEAISSEFECGLGKWIYEHAMENYGHIAEMHELEKVHAQIHVVARQLLERYRSGQVETARDGLAQIDEIANRLMVLIDAIEKKSGKL